MPTINFLNYNIDKESMDNSPVPAIKAMSEWYKKIPKYNENQLPDDPTISTVKGCMPFFDAMSSGYVFLTPCDIEFYIEDNIPKVKIFDDNFLDFVGTREPIKGFFHPKECYEIHFHWLPNWAVSLEDGYSAIYLNPLNRYELPFVTTSGIIDNDSMNARGQIPFFLKHTDKSIFLQKGTPFVQIIPIKREDWISNPISLTKEESLSKYEFALSKYRSVKNGGYKAIDWNRKNFK